MGQRRSWFVCGLLAIVLGLGWLIHGRFIAWPGVRALTAERWYAIETSPDTGTFDLSFEPGERYLLIVSSLSAAPGIHPVTLTSEPIQRQEFLPATHVVPLDAADSSDRIPARRVSQVARTSSPNTDSQASREREFFLHVTDGELEDHNSYVKITGRLLDEGMHVRVYLDRQQRASELAVGLVDEIISFFDRELLPKTVETLGTYCDVDGDGKFLVLLSHWLDRLQGGKTSLGGFVRSTDFRRDLEPPFSNQCDMLYLNSGLTPGPHLQTLLAHEFTHAISCSERLPVRHAGQFVPDEEDWLNEAIAHVAENRFGSGWSNLDHRVHEFLNDPHDYPLIVPDYYRSGLWRNHGCRGATYLFLRWCVDEFGEQTLGDLIRSPCSGSRNLELATAVPFADLFRRWSMALAEQGPAPRDAGGYRTLDLHREVGQWLLAGPKIERWDVDGAPKQLQVAGTSSAFLELHSGSRQACRRIQLKADYGAQLQVSILKMPSESPQLDVAANWHVFPGGPASSAGSALGEQLEVEVALESGEKFEIEHVTLEPRDAACMRQVRLEGEVLAAAGDGGAHAPTFHGRFRLPFRAPTGFEQGCVAKVVARDARGRRVVAWQTIGAAANWRSQFAFAETGRDTVRQ